MMCKLRPWRMEDAADLAAALNNKHIHDNLRDGLPYPYTEADARDFIGAMLSADPHATFAFAITLADKAVGSIGVFRKENIHFRTAEMGYYIAEPYWGKGIGSSAVQQACQYVFENTDILRIFAEPFAYNAASCRVLEKSGFVYEGTLKSNAVKNGMVLDMKLYARVKA
ncbi:MAG: GNAT family protein [Clostridia bacterium]|nr:GNAT family protein [Clostridia bacterium]